MNSDAPPSLPNDVRRWASFLGRYREPDIARSGIELAVTVLPLIGLWSMMWAALQFDVRLCLVLSVPAAGFLVRLFMIQHDCGHGAFFRGRRLNDWVGRIAGVLTLTPYDYWQRTHALHHAGTGHLGHRGIGDVTTLTVREYLALNGWRRFAYRLYRQPLVLFGIGPAYLFLLQHRLPFGLMRAGWQPWASTMSTNVAIVLLAIGIIEIIGLYAFLVISLPTVFLAASAGVWLFYVQHQFEETYWAADPEWNHPDASLKGSSHYVLPGVLRWLTANIGAHQVHHLNSRIPFYRLPEVLRNHPELAATSRLTVVESLRCIRLTLWDEDRRRLISFRDIASRPMAAAA